MIIMRFREMTSCAEHKQDIIILEDASGNQTLAIAADPDESGRLVRELARGPDGEHPIYDFVDAVLRTFRAAPTRVVLRYVSGAGLGAAVSFQLPEGEVTVPCYPSDALALARRANVPIYVSADVFSQVRPFRPAPTASDDPGQLLQWLERVRPVDFSPSPPCDRLTAE